MECCPLCNRVKIEPATAFNLNSRCGQDARPALVGSMAILRTGRSRPSLDPSFYGKIYAAPDVEDEEEYFTDKKHWYNANPSLGHTISIESFEGDAKEAQNTRTRRNAWLRYRLNRPVAIDGRFITPEAWNVGNREWSAPLEGRKCWCALDLASTRDLTCFLSLFPSEDGETHDVDCKFFIPKDCLQERVNRDHVPYDRWMADGSLRPRRQHHRL